MKFKSKILWSLLGLSFWVALLGAAVANRQMTIRAAVVVALAGSAVALLLALFLARSIAAPVEKLTQATSRFWADPAGSPPPRSAGDEISRITAALESLAQTRLEAEQALRGARADLESQIVERAAELARAHELFRQEVAARKRAEQRLSIAYAISRILAESPPWQQAMREVLQNMGGVLRWEAGAFWMADHRAGVLRCSEIWCAPHLPADEFKSKCRHRTFARGDGLPGTVWAGGRSAWSRDVPAPSNSPRPVPEKPPGLSGEFAFPIFIGNGVGGVVEFYSLETREPDLDLCGALAGIGSQLGQFLERKGVEEHLVQSQRLETVGKLAGGIAHEFNNMMTAILGQSELLLQDLPERDPLRAGVIEISTAAARAANLTRQLLAYGRKQHLRPAILDLNAVLSAMAGVLSHLMGPGVEISLLQAAGLKLVRADAGQIEQVVVIIAMNSADAMPNGGKLTLETANVTLDAGYVGRVPDLKPGGYVLLAITDSGVGMREEVKARVFEPFFTTKGVGRGIGLGLATCHGIIKQSGGHITVYSEQGRGTTLRIYLPQAGAPANDPESALKPDGLPRGTETILLVEDDPALREMASWLLRRLGYTIHTAGDGVEAMTVAHQPDTGHIDLLFTDVVMPHMSGEELAVRVRALFPRTSILFTTAHTPGAIAGQGILRPGAELLQKPFTPSALAQKVREILDASRTGATQPA